MIHRLAGFVLVDLGIAAALIAALLDLDEGLTLVLWVLAGVLVAVGLIQLAVAWYLYPRAR